MENGEGFNYLQETKDETEYICRNCGKQFTSKKSLVLHMKLHKNVISEEKRGDMYVCQKCGKKAKTKQALERHAAYHLDERPFACKMCHQRFKNSDDQGKHYRRLKRDGKFEHACTTCHKHFKSDELLRKHLVMLGCLSKSVRVDGAELQKESTELKDDGIAVDKTENHMKDVKVVNSVICRCKICELSFQSPELLKAHYRHDHGDLKKQVCIQCGQTLSSRDSLSRHYSIFHQEEFPFPCDQCEQKFKIKESLYRHVKFVHTDGGYQCPVCKHVFSQPVNLKKHMSVHTEHKEHICEVCGKRFRWRQGLVKHQNLHTDQKSCKEHKRNEKPNIVNDQSCHKVESIRDDFFSDKMLDMTLSQELLKVKVPFNAGKLQENLNLDCFQTDHPEKSDETVSEIKLPFKSQKIEYTVEDKKVENALQTKSMDMLLKYDTETCDSSVDSLDKVENNKVQTELNKTYVETVETSLIVDSVNAENARKRKHANNTIIEIKDKHGKVQPVGNVELLDNGNPGDLYLKNKQRKLTDRGDNERMLSADVIEKALQTSMDNVPSACCEPSNTSDSDNRDMKLNKEKDMKKDSNVLPLDSCKVVDEGEKINFNAMDVNGHGTRKSNKYHYLEHLGEHCKIKEVQDLDKVDYDDTKRFNDCNAKSKSDSNHVKHSSAFVDDNAKDKRAISVHRHGSEIEEMESNIDVHRKHFFKPSSLPLILAPADMTNAMKNTNKYANERSDSENEITGAASIAEASVPKVSKNPFIIQNSCCKVTKASVCHSSHCKTQPYEDSKALDLSTSETNQRAMKAALTLPANITSGKFSLIKHMLSLQNEEHFDKSLFENPLYYRSAEVQDFKKLAEMHRISDDVNSEEYDLSAKQNIPLHWLCLSRGKRNDRNETKCVEYSSVIENGLGQKSEERGGDETKKNNENSICELYPFDKSNLDIKDHNEATIIGVSCATSYSSSTIVESNSPGYRSPIKTSTLNEIPISPNIAAVAYSPRSSSYGNGAHYSLPIPSTSTDTRTLVSTMRLVSSEMAICSGADQLQRKDHCNSASKISSINKGRLVHSDSNGIPYIPSVIATKSPDMKNEGFSATSGKLTHLTGRPVNLVKHVQLNTQATLHNSGCLTSSKLLPSAQSFCFNSSTMDNDTLFSRSVSWSGAVQKGSSDYDVEKTGCKPMMHHVNNIPMTKDYVRRPDKAFEKTTLIHGGCVKNQEFAQKKSTHTNFHSSANSQSTFENTSDLDLNRSVSRSNTVSNDVYIRQGYDSCLYQPALDKYSGHFLTGPAENVTYNGRNLQEVNKGRHLLEETTLNVSNSKNINNAGNQRDCTSTRMPVLKDPPNFSDLSSIHVKHVGYTLLNQGINETQEQHPVNLHVEYNQQGLINNSLVNRDTEGTKWGGQNAVNKHDSIAYTKSTDGSGKKEGVSVFELLQFPTAANRFKDFQNIEHVLKHCFS